MLSETDDPAVAARVTLVGRRSNPEYYFGSADAFVFPTAYEAAPLVGYEAAAAGLPLVVTRVNGLEDFVEHGVNGLFVERDAASVAKALQMLEDTALRRKLGAAAKHKARRYSWRDVADAYVRLYDETAVDGG